MQNNRKMDGRKMGMTLAAALLLSLGVAGSVEMNKPAQPVYRPTRGFSNICAYEGQVYCGVNGAYGEPILQQSSIFTIWEDKVYYVEKVQEAYDSMTDELLAVKRAGLDGSGEEVLAEDVFLAGAGHEKLAGDKLFYGCKYDDNHRMHYAFVDVNTGKREELDSDRIDTVLGYDGNYLYYNGYDTEKEENILGRIRLRNGRDETLASYAAVDEEGYIDSVSFLDGKLYCLTLVHKPEGYDYRTYEYRLQVRSGENGRVEREIPVKFTGSSNYSFLVQDGELYATLNGDIIAVPLDGGEERKLAEMRAEEYWGILHFIPGDGYLYYEAIAEEDEETGNNDYFYRVPINGGKSELLKEWFTV